jgi:ketosteroid isomerase-like protein
MAEVYVKRLQRGYRAFRLGGVDAIVQLVGPELEVRDRESAPDRETLIGGDGIRELVRLNEEVFDQLELEPREFIDAGDYVLVVLRMRVRGRTSGAALECETVHAWEFRNGHAARMQIYADKARALEALGLVG